MQKVEIVNQITAKTGIEQAAVSAVVETFMSTIKSSMAKGEPVYFRGFGTFRIKKRAAKTARNISKNTAVKIPAHNIPNFKPCREFINEVKTKVKIE